MSWSRFVAIGDSFTEGLNDPYSGGGSFRGWADLVAEKLASEYEAQASQRATSSRQGDEVDGPSNFLYANLAIRGRKFSEVVAEQVPAALAMAPDLVSFNAGGNDVLLPKLDTESMLQRFSEVVADLRAASADVIIFALPDVTDRLPRRGRIYPRLVMFNSEMERLASQLGAILVDMWSDDTFKNPRLWSDDRLHLLPAGHRRVAALTMRGLGVEPDSSWLAPPEPPPARSWAGARLDDWRWVRRYYFPWLKRRLTGRTTGDGLVAKRPALDPIAAVTEQIITS